MVEAVERCALPGCDEIIVQPTGTGPRRKYCSAEHRAASRRLRREDQHRRWDLSEADEPEDADSASQPDRAAAASSNEKPGPPARLEVGRRIRSDASGGAPKKRRRRRRDPQVAAERRRKLITIGTAAILVTGTTVAGIDKLQGEKTPAGPPSPGVGAPTSTPRVTAPLAPQGASQWADQARAQLVAVREQLDEIARAEATWSRTSRKPTGAGPADAIAQLGEQKKALTQWEVALKAQLATWDSLQSGPQRLEKIQADLAKVESAMRSAQATKTSSRQQPTASRQLDDQRGVLLRQRTALLDELKGAQDGVNAAMKTSFPNAADAVQPLVKYVLALAEQSVTPSQPSKPKSPARKVPASAANRQTAADTQNRPVAPAPPGTTSPPASPHPSTAGSDTMGVTGVPERSSKDCVADLASLVDLARRQYIGHSRVPGYRMRNGRMPVSRKVDPAEVRLAAKLLGAILCDALAKNSRRSKLPTATCRPPGAAPIVISVPPEAVTAGRRRDIGSGSASNASASTTSSKQSAAKASGHGTAAKRSLARKVPVPASLAMHKTVIPPAPAARVVTGASTPRPSAAKGINENATMPELVTARAVNDGIQNGLVQQVRQESMSAPVGGSGLVHSSGGCRTGGVEQFDDQDDIEMASARRVGRGQDMLTTILVGG